MEYLGFTISEMGLNYTLISLTVFFSIFFLITFVITSRNMDSKGLLRVLYSKPVRNKDGIIEYPKEQ